jgi:hypothetical protein
LAVVHVVNNQHGNVGSAIIKNYSHENGDE